MDEDHEPTTTRGQRLRAAKSSAGWARAVSNAQARARVVEAVLRRHHEVPTESWQASLAEAAPEVAWGTYKRWRRRYDRGEGKPWERLLDGRVPPKVAVPDSVRRAACLLRRADASLSSEMIRSHLVAEFGDTGRVSDTTLRRVWAAAGLEPPRRAGDRAAGGRREETVAPDEDVEHFHGGGGLALIAAADAELRVSLVLARSIQSVPEREGVPAPDDDREGRDDLGRFTAAYNERHRAGIAPGEADSRWSTDTEKSERRDTSILRTRHLAEQTLAAKLLAMGMTPLLTERRGFDGLDGPAGHWLGVTGSVAYKPATLDKALAELGLLGVDQALWQAHAEQWFRITRTWSVPGPDWLQTILYVDGTADPYWTRAFAASGKVSRVGRVMPCLTRIAINSGAGVPVLVETHAGAASLKARLVPMLEKARQAAGPRADMDRLTVVDSEAGTAGTLWALHENADVFFVSVIKGQVLAGARLVDEGRWIPFRERDEVAEASVLISGRGAPEAGVHLRAVRMRRSGGRHPQTTVFVTNAGMDDLSTQDVPSVYLERWPRQEQTFRDGRNGAGLNRSHGYGRAQVTHVALETKQQKAHRRAVRADTALEKATRARDDLTRGLAKVPSTVRKQALALADAKIRQAKKQKGRSEAEAALLQSMPSTIQARDTGRDSIMTCLKVAVASLVQVVLKEYFGGVAMEWRTFIEHFVALPVTVRTTRTRRCYQIHANLRRPDYTTLLAKAIDEINRRRIRRGKHLLVFELLGGEGPGP